MNNDENNTFLLKNTFTNKRTYNFFHTYNAPELLDFIYTYAPDRTINSVLKAMDNYATDVQYMMNIGPKNAIILENEIIKKRMESSKIRILELGTYCGYSTLCILKHLQNDIFYSIDMSKPAIDITNKVLEYVHKRDAVRLIRGAAEDVLEAFIEPFDIIFIDHHKDKYLSDMLILERLGLIKTGTTIVADNVGLKKSMPYLEYIRNNNNYISTFYESTLAYNDAYFDAVEVSVRV